MWTAFVRESARRWQPAGVSVVICAGLGAVLRGLLRPGSTAGVWTWPLLGALCAVAVGLAWPLLAALRGGALEPAAVGVAAGTSVLERVAVHRGRARQTVRWGIGLGLAAALFVAALTFYRAGKDPTDQPTRPVVNPPPVRQPVPPTADTTPQPEPTIRIGNYILVRAPHSRAGSP